MAVDAHYKAEPNSMGAGEDGNPVVASSVGRAREPVVGSAREPEVGSSWEPVAGRARDPVAG